MNGSAPRLAQDGIVTVTGASGSGGGFMPPVSSTPDPPGDLGCRSTAG
jgi:hypothetical protein